MTSIIKQSLILLFSLTLVSPCAFGQIVAPAGRTLFNEGLLVRSVIRFDDFGSSDSSGDLERIINSWAVVWGARPNLSLSFVTPFIHTSNHFDGGRTSTTGRGDSTLFARYDLYRKNHPKGYTRISPELGIKLPTGSVFGSGSTDPIAGLVFARVGDPHWLIGDVQFTFPGEGDDSLRRGRILRYDLAYLRPVPIFRGLGSPMTLVVFELNGVSNDRSRRDGITIDRSGGDVLHFTAGIEVFLNRRIVLEIGSQIPIQENLRGGPTSDYSVIIGLRWLS